MYTQIRKCKSGRKEFAYSKIFWDILVWSWLFLCVAKKCCCLCLQLAQQTIVGLSFSCFLNCTMVLIHTHSHSLCATHSLFLTFPAFPSGKETPFQRQRGDCHAKPKPSSTRRFYFHSDLGHQLPLKFFSHNKVQVDPLVNFSLINTDQEMARSSNLFSAT